MANEFFCKQVTPDMAIHDWMSPALKVDHWSSSGYNLQTMYNVLLSITNKHGGNIL